MFIVIGITIISHIWSYYFWLFANIYTLDICRLQYFVVIKTAPPLWHDIMQQYIYILKLILLIIYNDTLKILSTMLIQCVFQENKFTYIISSKSLHHFMCMWA